MTYLQVDCIRFSGGQIEQLLIAVYSGYMDCPAVSCLPRAHDIAARDIAARGLLVPSMSA